VQNRIALVLSVLAAGSALAAAGLGLNGYRTNPAQPGQPGRPLAAPLDPDDKDPLAPRLFDQSNPIRIHVAGAVKKPGVYSLPSWARVVDAMKKAGGPTAAADLDAINLADLVRDGEQLRIPARGRREHVRLHQPAPEPPVVPPGVGGRGTGRYPFAARAAALRTADVAPASAGSVNLNSATREQLDSLPGVGPSTADSIVAYREQNGPYLRPEDLMNVRGIGPKKFDRLRARISAP
jgi:competence protein ComEA